MHPRTSGLSVSIGTAVSAGILFQTYNLSTYIFNNLNKLISPQYTTYAQPLFLTGAFAVGGECINAFKTNSTISRFISSGMSASLLYAFSAVTYGFLNHNFGSNNPLTSAGIGIATLLCSAVAWNYAFEKGVNPVLKIGANTLDNIFELVKDSTGVDISGGRSFRS